MLMRSLLTLAWSSLGSRRFVALMTVACIALGSAVLIVVEQVRTQAREAFTRSVSGVDLIVGPRGGSVELLRRGLSYRNARARHALRVLPPDCGASRSDLGTASQFRGFAPWLPGDGHRGGLFQIFSLWTFAATGFCRRKSLC